MIKYKDLIRTLEIFAKYEGDDEYVGTYAEHDEFGIQFPADKEITIEDLKELRTMGWMLGSDYEWDDDSAKLWDPETEEGKNATDEQLLELWENYCSVWDFV